MIIRNNTNADIERHKARLGLTGDVYIVNGVQIETLESHKRLLPTSTATTIEEAEQERIAYEAEIEAQRQALVEEEQAGELEEK